MGADSTAPAVVRLVERARFEVLPTADTEAMVVEHLPLDRVVTITASPRQGLEATLDLAERLALRGHAVVPHLAARMVSGRAELAEIVHRLTSAGVQGVFVPAGDAEPVGDYRDALALLEDLARLGSPFAHVGVTGYPESHPTIHDDVTVQSLWDKRRHATHVVSNLTFDPAAVSTWISRLRARGVTTPVLLGVPGPVARAKLLATATRIGVGESTRFLAKNKGLFARLAAPGGFTGERFVLDCAPAAVAPEARVEGLHVFTFNQIAATERWRSDLLARLPEQRHAT
ncbi:methylenetetrahydrofolate reductase [Microlunatus lacustris]